MCLISIARKMHRIRFKKGGNKMLKVGDTVKVIAPTINAIGIEKEYIPIGTICTVTDIRQFSDGVGYALDAGDGVLFWYLENELEKGHIEWIKDE